MSNHIYPDLKENYIHYEKINENMIKRIGLRDHIYDLWGINGEFLNKEIFGLNLHIENYGQILPIYDVNFSQKIGLYKFFKKQETKLNDIGTQDFYHNFFSKFFDKFIYGITKTLKQNEVLPKDFSYEIIYSKNTDIKIVSYYEDEIVIKSFITIYQKYFLLFQLKNMF